MIQPSSRIGILGGGQLGRMLAMAGARLGLEIWIYEPDLDCPAARVTAKTITGAYSDLDAIADFARQVDVVTFEFENVPVNAAQMSAQHAILRPGIQALTVAQDRLIEKTFLNDHGVETVLFQDIETQNDLEAAIEILGLPAILKTRRMGYDGKGQSIIKQGDALDSALSIMAEGPALLEAFAPFKRELSIVAARGISGEVKAFPLSENTHQNGILRESFAPAIVDDHTRQSALNIATTILDALDYVGILAVEFFELESGKLLVNEIAPRVHNTGHWTQDACLIDQFEQHMRAIAGWALGDPEPFAPARMVNLIGNDAQNWRQWLVEPNAVLHLYGKHEMRQGRKMGHVNIVERS